MLFFNSFKNVEAVPIRFLNFLKIPIERADLVAEIERHPNYPSLLAISDILTNYAVKNHAFRIEKEQLNDLICPFIAQTSVNQGEFVVVKNMSSNLVWLSNEKWTNHKMTITRFKEIFAGVILVAEPSDDPLPPIPKKVITSLNISPQIITMLGVFILLFTAIYNSMLTKSFVIQQDLLFILKTLGLGVSGLLLLQSIDKNNPLIQKICKNDSKFNCNAILTSKAAKLTGWLSWSEIGFFYFSTTWLALLFMGHGAFTILGILNFVSLPYTIYSIYYQARIAKQWCILCCTIQVLLWLEFIPLAIGFNFSAIDLKTEYDASLLFFLLSPVVFWMLIKPLLLDQQQLNPLKDQLRKFKYNPELFYKMLKEQSRFSSSDKEWSITMGSENPKHIITMVSNPYCQPCANLHPIIKELIRARDDVQIRIVFSTRNLKSDPKFNATQHLLALNALEDKRIIEGALENWYRQENKKFEIWAKKYPVEIKEDIEAIMDKQRSWCVMANIVQTPTLLIDGYILPDMYQLKDLKYMLE